jgi:hypothetical protein
MPKKDELPQAMVDRMAREENEADRELIAKPVRAAKDKIMSVVGPAWQAAFDKKAAKDAAEKADKDAINKSLDGGAYVGSRLNMPSNTRLGKLSASDTRLLNKTDAMKKNPYATEKDSEYKKGGKVKARGCGIARKGLTKGRMV